MTAHDRLGSNAARGMQESESAQSPLRNAPSGHRTKTTDRRELAFQLRIQLVALIAPDSCCALCGEQTEPEDLEIDHVDGITYDRKALAAWSRAAAYWDDYDAGERLRALCKSCNSRDGHRFRGQPRYTRSAA